MSDFSDEEASGDEAEQPPKPKPDRKTSMAIKKGALDVCR